MPYVEPIMLDTEHGAIPFRLKDFSLKKYRAVLKRGLSCGIGSHNGAMCIEAAICHVLGLDHGDEPGCVDAEVRDFKIRLNDCEWTSNIARAKGLYELGLAQLGSLDRLSGSFSDLLFTEIVRKMVPKAFDAFCIGESDLHVKCHKAAHRCGRFPTSFSLKQAKDAANDLLWSGQESSDFLSLAMYDLERCDFGDFASHLHEHAGTGDRWLIMTAQIALECLKKLKSPGCSLLSKAKKL